MKNKIRFLFSTSVTLLIFLALIFNAVEISANVAAPSQGGRVAGEPSGLEKITIKRENLTIDFRPLEDANKAVLIEAVYEVENTGAEGKPLELVFAIGNQEFSKFTFFLDDTPVAAQAGKNFPASTNWQKPRETVWQKGQKIMYDAVMTPSGFGVSLTVPPGAHKLKAVYKTEPTRYYGNAPVLLYQFAYILSPSGDWSNFGGLDVTVNIPAGWQIVTDPNLQQNGEILNGHYDKIPADAFKFTIGKPLPDGYYLLNTFLTLLFFVFLIGLPLVMLFSVVRQALKNKFIQPASGLLWSLLWAGIVLAAGIGAIFGANYFYPAIEYGYGSVFLIFFLIVLCFVIFIVGSAVWAIAALIINNRKK